MSSDPLWKSGILPGNDDFAKTNQPSRNRRLNILRFKLDDSTKASNIVYFGRQWLN